MENTEYLQRITSGLTTRFEYLKDVGYECSRTPQYVKWCLLEGIHSDIGDCNRCRLGSTRRKIVIGSGNPDADILFIGEAPGAEEDARGLPFVGKAGQELTRLIKDILELSREDVYITNIVKCRPPNNRDPFPDEVLACIPFLFRQIEIIDPLIIVLLGAVATRNLLSETGKISRMRGEFIYKKGRIFLPTFHPSFLLRQPDNIRHAEADFKKLKEKYRIIRI